MRVSAGDAERLAQPRDAGALLTPGGKTSQNFSPWSRVSSVPSRTPRSASTVDGMCAAVVLLRPHHEFDDVARLEAVEGLKTHAGGSPARSMAATSDGAPPGASSQ